MTIAVVGGGKMGLSHLAIVARIVGRERVAVCDSSLAVRLVYRRLGFKTFRSFDAMLGAGEVVTGAIIATPTGSHYAVARRAIEASIPCFVEKPLTLDVARSRELQLLADAKSVPVQMGFVLRYAASYSRLREIVRSDALGRALRYRACMLGNVITAPNGRSWRADYRRGGGCLNEYGPHLIDLCRFAFGDVQHIATSDFVRRHSQHADDRIDFTWRHVDGTEGALHLDWCDSSRRKSVIEFDVEFSRGRAQADNSSFRWEGLDSPDLTPGQAAVLEAPLVPAPVGFYLRGEEYSLQLEDFLLCCEGTPRRVRRSVVTGNAASILDGVAVDELIASIAAKAGLA
jgi:scyllo-inositol 2-dehydrogenase (NADP+)